MPPECTYWYIQVTAQHCDQQCRVATGVVDRAQLDRQTRRAPNSQSFQFHSPTGLFLNRRTATVKRDWLRFRTA